MCRFAPLGAALLFGACAPTETLFQSNFNTTPVGSPPAPAQAVGTATWFGSQGDVRIMPPMAGSTDNWLHIQRDVAPNNSGAVAGLTGTLSQVRPPGTFHFVSAMYMPTSTQTATIEFDAFNPNPANGQRFQFMHLDFRPEHNQVRIDDDPKTDFGTFPRDTPFDVFVQLNTSASPPNATISITGGGATGSATRTIQFPNQAQQFGAVTIWMGFPWTGYFHTTDLLVTHDTQ